MTFPMSPFKVVGGKLVIPNKYLEVLETVDEQTDFSSLRATAKNWKMVREKIVVGYWMEWWYDENLPTMQTEFYELWMRKSFDRGKFARLNSLSSKDQTRPVYNLEGVTKMMESERCLESVKLSRRTGVKVVVAVRNWVDMSVGVEWRCFVYDGKLRAIGLNDDRCVWMAESEVASRASALFEKVQYDVPCLDCVMDIWLDDNDPERDLVIEFNSYGFWGNAGIDKFDWVEDAALLYGMVDEGVVVRM